MVGAGVAVEAVSHARPAIFLRRISRCRGSVAHGEMGHVHLYGTAISSFQYGFRVVLILPIQVYHMTFSLSACLGRFSSGLIIIQAQALVQGFPLGHVIPGLI